MTVLIKDLSELLNFRYKPWTYVTWENIGTEEKTLQSFPDVYGHFKYILYKHIRVNDHVENKNVFCHTHFLRLLPKLLSQNPDEFDNLVVMGDDKVLSDAKFICNERIQKGFKNIYFEAKDIECDWARAIPMGVNYAYTLRAGGNEVVLPHINKKKNKTRLISSAFGSKWGFLTKRIPDRRRLKRFTRESDFMDNMFCDPLEYFEKLCDYKFFASPLGNGVQTPKICEAILCETVPVVTDHVAHRELRDIYGLSLLIVKRWKDLNEDFLNEQWDAVYSKVDWDTQKNKFLVKNFNKLLELPHTGIF